MYGPLPCYLQLLLTRVFLPGVHK